MKDFKVSNDSIPANYPAGNPAPRHVPNDSVPTTEDIRQAFKILGTISGSTVLGGVIGAKVADAGVEALKKAETDKTPEQKSE